MSAPVLQIRPGDSLWPASLEAIESAPDCLWLRGRSELLAQAPRIAVVGTRAPTPYGVAQARRFARQLAAAGVVVVSGLARGIDESAHRSALEVGGSTLAVLGSGVDCPWPAGELAECLARDGLLLSEFAPGQAPRRHHFPLRNRILSGLCAGVLVVEAAQVSGSLITARWAIDQGRELWVVPGRVDHPMARGCHRLLRQGALLVEDPAEILEQLGVHCGSGASGAQPPQALPGQAVTPLAERLLLALRGETLGVDELSQRLREPARRILSELALLELEGRLARSPGGLYRQLS